MKFDEMQIDDRLKKAVRNMNYIEATDVQVETIGHMLKYRNVVVKSHTGSGKTAAFGIPISEGVLQGKSKGVLVLCPTRELAVQVKDELRKINSETGLKVAAVYGGHGINFEIAAFKKGVDIIVATSGRLLDHIRQGSFDPLTYDTVVLDEADRMLDMGFIHDLKQILHAVRPMNTHLFSATLDRSVAEIIREYIQDYEEITIPHEIIGKNILERHVKVNRDERFNALLGVIEEAKGDRVLVFVSTKRNADSISRKLHKNGFRVECIHGDKSQRAREFALQNFRSGKNKILVATDVAARGLQIDNVEFVVNYDLAGDHDTHKHRIGRTGRMGDTGYAITFVNESGSVVEPQSYFKKGRGFSQGPNRNFSGNGFRERNSRSGNRGYGGFTRTKNPGFRGRNRNPGSRWNDSAGKPRGSGHSSHGNPQKFSGGRQANSGHGNHSGRHAGNRNYQGSP